MPRYLLALAMACAVSALAAGARADADIVHRQLANGLTVLVQRDPHLPRVGISVVYNVGSSNDPSPGLAKITARLMRGRVLHSPERVDRAFALMGATHQVSVLRDQTVFQTEVAADAWEQVLWLESDRMAYTLAVANDDALEAAIRVVRRARDAAGLFGDMLALAASEVLYPKGHPYYGLPAETLENPSLDELRAFFQTWYGPGNATIAVVGAVEPEAVFRAIDRYFGSIRPSTWPPPDRHHEEALPLPTKSRRITLRGTPNYRFLDRNMLIVWRSPAWLARDDAELDVLATILSRHLGLRLSAMNMVTALDVGQYSYPHAGELRIEMRLNDSADAVLDVIDDVLRQLVASDLSADLQYARHYWWNKRSPDHFAERASFLAKTGNQTLESDRERHVNVDERAIKRVLSTYVIGRGRVTALTSTESFR